jgi:hypothetical protein
MLKASSYHCGAPAMESALGSLCFCSVGGFCVWVGSTLARKTLALTRHGIRVRALVVGHAKGIDGDPFPIVEFQDATGRVWRVEVSIANRIPVGELLDVVYDVRDPSQVQTLSIWERWAGPVILLVWGGVALALGLSEWVRVVQ